MISDHFYPMEEKLIGYRKDREWLLATRGEASLIHTIATLRLKPRLGQAPVDCLLQFYRRRIAERWVVLELVLRVIVFFIICAVLYTIYQPFLLLAPRVQPDAPLVNSVMAQVEAGLPIDTAKPGFLAAMADLVHRPLVDIRAQRAVYTFLVIYSRVEYRDEPGYRSFIEGPDLYAWEAFTHRIGRKMDGNCQDIALLLASSLAKEGYQYQYRMEGHHVYVHVIDYDLDLNKIDEPAPAASPAPSASKPDHPIAATAIPAKISAPSSLAWGSLIPNIGYISPFEAVRSLAKMLILIRPTGLVLWTLVFFVFLLFSTPVQPRLYVVAGGLTNLLLIVLILSCVPLGLDFWLALFLVLWGFVVVLLAKLEARSCFQHMSLRSYGWLINNRSART